MKHPMPFSRHVRNFAFALLCVAFTLAVAAYAIYYWNVVYIGLSIILAVMSALVVYVSYITDRIECREIWRNHENV